MYRVLVYSVAPLVLLLLLMGGSLQGLRFALGAEWNPSDGGYVQNRVSHGLCTDTFGVAYQGNYSDYVYVTCYSVHALRRVNIRTWEVSTWAVSSGSDSFRNPIGIVWSAVAGQFFVASRGNNQIRTFQPSEPSPIERLYAGGWEPASVPEGGVQWYPANYPNGPRLNASFNAPNGLTIANERELLIADPGNKMIRRITIHSSTSVNNSVSTVIHDVVARTIACVGHHGSSMCYANNLSYIVRFHYDVVNVTTTVSGPQYYTQWHYYSVVGLTIIPSTGDLLISTGGTNRLRRLDLSNGAVWSDYAGNGRDYPLKNGFGTNASIDGPQGILIIHPTANTTFIVVAGSLHLSTIGGGDNGTGDSPSVNPTTGSPYHTNHSSPSPPVSSTHPPLTPPPPSHHTNQSSPSPPVSSTHRPYTPPANTTDHYTTPVPVSPSPDTDVARNSRNSSSSEGLFGTGTGGTVTIISAIVASVVLLAIGITMAVLYRSRSQKRRQRTAAFEPHHPHDDISTSSHTMSNQPIDTIVEVTVVEEMSLQEEEDSYPAKTAGVEEGFCDAPLPGRPT